MSVKKADRPKPTKPKRFETPELLEALIETYFIKCDGRMIPVEGEFDENGDQVRRNVPEPYTVLGLCGHLKCTRATLYDYEGYPAYSYIVKRAKEKIAQNLSLRAIENRTQTVGCIFQLKCNHGHAETKIVDNVSSDGSMSPKRELSEDEVRDELKKRGLPLPQFDK